MPSRHLDLTQMVRRPVTSADLAFLERLYASTRLEELSASGWSAQEIADFLAMQFRMQHTYYQAHYPDADFEIVQLAGEDIGRIYTHRGRDSWSLIDIALLPAFRGQGIGSSLVVPLLAEAAACGKPLTLHVEHNNPANRLYARLGFEQEGTNGVYLKLCWRRAKVSHADAVGLSNPSRPSSLSAMFPSSH